MFMVVVVFTSIHCDHGYGYGCFISIHYDRGYGCGCGYVYGCVLPVFTVIMVMVAVVVVVIVLVVIVVH